MNLDDIKDWERLDTMYYDNKMDCYKYNLISSQICSERRMALNDFENGTITIQKLNLIFKHGSDQPYVYLSGNPKWTIHKENNVK